MSALAGIAEADRRLQRDVFQRWPPPSLTIFPLYFGGAFIGWALHPPLCPDFPGQISGLVLTDAFPVELPAQFGPQWQRLGN